MASPARIDDARGLFRARRPEANREDAVNYLKPFAAVCAIALYAMLAAAPANAAAYCVHQWAKPGTYAVAGRFKERIRRTTAQLSTSCRVRINVPGVFTGGPVRKSGDCVEFSFKVQGDRRTFTARWCNTYVVIPYEGRDVRATVHPEGPARTRLDRPIHGR